MSATYTVTLTAEELEVVTEALGYTPAAKPVKPRVATVAIPVFDTGDDQLDAFMRRSWKPSDTTKAAARAAVPKPAALKPKKRTAAELREITAFNEAAIKAWRALGHRVEVRGHNGTPDPDGSNVIVYPVDAK